MSRAGWKVHYLIREASGCNLVIQPVRDSAYYWFHALIKSGEFNDCMELIEILTNDRGRVVQERVTHSYSKIVGHVIEHTARPAVTAKPTVEVVCLAEEFCSTSLL
jgi:hypothetical protein